MKNKELFEETIGVWISAFLDGTLAKGSCAACAIGNLAAHALGYKIDKEILLGMFYDDYTAPWMTWRLSFCTSTDNGIQYSYPERHVTNSNVAKILNALKYPRKDLMKIEFAFETSTRIYFKKYSQHSEKEILEDQFNGLMACFTILEEIHEIEDTSYRESFKESLMVKL